jgi:hypothetical protein
MLTSCASAFGDLCPGLAHIRSRLPSTNLDAKAWLNRHIAEMRPHGFLFQMRFYRIAAHTVADTQVLQKAAFVAHRSRSSGSSHG